VSTRIKHAARVALVFVAAIGTTVMAGGRARAKDANTFQILTGFSSKEACSCAFVVEQSDEYCTAFGRIGGYAVEVAIDRGARSVTSSFLGTVRTSRFTEGAGCRLDPLP